MDNLATPCTFLPCSTLRKNQPSTHTAPRGQSTATHPAPRQPPLQYGSSDCCRGGPETPPCSPPASGRPRLQGRAGGTRTQRHDVPAVGQRCWGVGQRHSLPPLGPKQSNLPVMVSPISLGLTSSWAPQITGTRYVFPLAAASTLLPGVVTRLPAAEHVPR